VIDRIPSLNMSNYTELTGKLMSVSIRSLLVATFIIANISTAAAAPLTPAQHRKLAIRFERTNKFLNIKFPNSYGAPVYHAAKAKRQ